MIVQDVNVSGDRTVLGLRRTAKLNIYGKPYAYTVTERM